MRLKGLAVAAALLAAGACAWTTATAQAQIAWAPCGDSNDFACGHLTVPLDPSGATPGTITLAMRRHRAPVGEAHEAVIALAGGPGQAAIPFTEQFAHLLGPIAAHARSDRLRPARHRPVASAVVPPLRTERRAALAGQQIAECAAQIGPDAHRLHDRRRPSPTSRRSGRRAAMKSSCCTEPPTGRRWPSATPRPTRATSRRSCSTRSCPRTGRNR